MFACKIVFFTSSIYMLTIVVILRQSYNNLFV
nr:MAG TPA: hypothetical protein [Bacteriophage sp.]